MIKSERGAYSTTHGAYQHFAVKIVAGLVGATDVPGGFLGSEQGPVLSPGPDGVVSPKQEAQPVPWQQPPSIDLREYYPHRHTSPYLAWKTVLDPEKYGVDHNLDMLMVYGSNPIHSNCTPIHAIEAFKKIPFMASIALVYDETTQFADILLPESTILERHALLEYGDHVVHAADEAILRTRTLQVSQAGDRPRVEHPPGRRHVHRDRGAGGLSLWRRRAQRPHQPHLEPPRGSRSSTCTRST